VLRVDGIRFIYRGYFWYALHYSINYSTQIALFETMVAHCKQDLGYERYYKYEGWYIA
jgi:hypothetical protein